MKTIEVVAAIIKQDNEILTTRRGYSEFENILKMHYDLVIVDEAHHLKNRKTVDWEFVNKPDKNANFLLINL